MFPQVVTSVSYILCAALGYLSFPTTAAGNILKTYPASAANDILVLSMAASIILSYPGQSPHFVSLLILCYISEIELTFPQLLCFRAANLWTVCCFQTRCMQSNAARASSDLLSCVANSQELTYIRYVAQNIAIVAVAYGIATAVPVFSTLLGVFGAVTSTIIAYILPTFFYMRTSNTSFLKDRFSWVALTLLILGGSAGMVSSVAQFLWTSVHEFLRQVLRS